MLLELKCLFFGFVTFLRFCSSPQLPIYLFNVFPTVSTATVRMREIGDIGGGGGQLFYFHALRTGSPATMANRVSPSVMPRWGLLFY